MLCAHIHTCSNVNWYALFLLYVRLTLVVGSAAHPKLNHMLHTVHVHMCTWYGSLHHYWCLP